MVANIGLPEDGEANRGYALWVVSTVMVIVAGLFVIARLYARYYRNGIQIDDWMILVALATSILLSVTENMAVVHGYGQHSWDLSRDEKIKARQWFFAANIVYKLVIGFAKISVLLLYLRIFYVRNYFRWACYGLIVFTALCTLSFTLATVWSCIPIAAFWDKSISDPDCLNSHAFWLSYALINIITDFLILALPVQQVVRLQLKKRDKLALVFVFSFGAFVCITSIVRATTLAASSASRDFTWSPIPATVWSVVECNTAIICACMPMIRQPLSVIFPTFFSHTEYTDESHAASYGLSSRRRKTASQNPGQSLATVLSSGNRTPWDRERSTEFYRTSISRNPGTSRTGSQERFIADNELEPNGIMKQTDVSVSDSATTAVPSPVARRDS